MESAGQATRVVDKINITLANGWAIYRVLKEYESELSLKLMDSEVTDGA